MDALDQFIFSIFNTFNSYSAVLNKIISVYETSDLLTIVPLTSLLWWFWFAKNYTLTSTRRKYVVSTIVACFFTGLICYFLVHSNFLFDIRPRPRCDSTIKFVIPYGLDAPSWEFCRDTHGTFPSGHAAVLFTVSMGLFYISRLTGGLCLIYSFIACLPRVYVGDHYFTDIIGGAIIGVVITCLSNLKLVENALTKKIMKWADHHPPSFYATFFIMSFNIVTYYSDVGRILKAMVTVLKQLIHSGP